MKLFIANCTAQRHDFQYRIVEQAGVKRQQIPMNGQIEIAYDLNQQQVDGIIAQHAPYGMVSVDEIDRTRPFIGLCYSVGKPIKVDALRRTLVHNRDVLEETGKKNRTEAGLAVAEQLMANDPANGGLQAVETSVVEVEPKDGHARDEEFGGKEVADGTRVDKNAERGAPPRVEKAAQRRSRERARGRG